MNTWKAAIFAIVGIVLWMIGIKIEQSILVGCVLFWAIYVIAQALDRHHNEQMAKIAYLELYLRSIENRLP